MAPPPAPFHILRAHQAPVSCVSFTRGNALLLAGDQDGFVSVSDLGTRRVVAYWKAHDGGVLNVEELDGHVLSQGRDNKLHLYERLHVERLDGAAAASSGPPIQTSMDSNSLNFCRFALTPYKNEALMALPNLVDSELIDIYAMPSGKRLHSKINYEATAAAVAAGKTDGGNTRSGLVMAVALRVISDRLALVAGYEDGRLEVWACDINTLDKLWDGRSSANTADSARPWYRLWTGKAHNEAIMALAVDPAFTRAFTVSADHLLCRVDLGTILSGEPASVKVESYSTKQIGNSSVAVSHDGKVVAVGGWDGRIRLLSAATFKSLGSLSFHRESVQALAFARADAKLLTQDDTIELGGSDSEDDDDDGQVPRDQWLASGGKDRRIALWGLKKF